MPYRPASGFLAASVTDSAGGAVSRTIADSGGAHAQSTENDERSSMVDAYNEVRTAFLGRVGRRGGGYRPIGSVTDLTLVGLTQSSTTVNAAGALYDQANENAYRADLGQEVADLVDDIQLATYTTGPNSTVTRLTDNSGGTASDNLNAGGVAYNQGNDNNARAVLAAKLNAVADAIGLGA